MSNITIPIQNLISAGIKEKQSKYLDPNEPKISISTRAGKATFVYERMRNAVDYKEEHLVRRNAIERILRRMISSGHRENISENLIHELIHARYLPNDTIPQRKILELEIILEKYFTLLGLVPLGDINTKNSLPSWTIGIMATEIDEFLVPPYIMHASINAMYENMGLRMHFEDDTDETEMSKQIYIASSRTLYKNEDDTIKYHLLLLYYPNWQNADQALIKEIGSKLPNIRNMIDNDIYHPVREKLVAILRKQTAYFSVITDIIREDPKGSYGDMQTGNAFNKRIEKICEQNYSASRSTLGRSIRRSIIYLVITKFLVAILLEVPIEYFVLGKFDVIPLLINLVFPPSLLAFIALSTKLPGEQNTELIIQGINNIIYGKKEIIQIPKKRKQSFILQLIFIISYGALFSLSFGMLIYILEYLNFSIISVLIFLFFLSLVSLFAYRIRIVGQELIVTPPRKGIIRSLWTFLSIPILHAGKWMSTKFARINVFIFILDFIIEAPFKSFVKIIEEWMSYVHEKKDEI
jgi:hypothetical protein